MKRYTRTILKNIMPFLIIMLLSSNIIFAADNNAKSSFKWWWEDEVPKLEGNEKDKFSETKSGYVYDGAELSNGGNYDFKDHVLYIRSNINIPIPANSKANLYIPSVTFNAKKVIIECDLNIYSKKVVFNSDLVIQNNGAIDLDSKATMDIQGDFIANSKQISKPAEGIINVYGNIELKRNWITPTKITEEGEERTGPTINVVGGGEHIIKGSNSCSVKKLSFSSESIKNTRFKTGFLFFKKMFLIDSLSLEYPKEVNVAQSSIDKYFICTDIEPGINTNLTMASQASATESYESFAKSFLYSLIMSTEFQGSKVNIFETYYHTKKSKNDIGIYSFNIKDRPIIVKNNKGELNKGSITINYIGVGQKINDNGMADITINMENGSRCHYWFTPKQSNEKEDAFLDTLKAGASDVIWDQAMDVLFSQVLSDIAELCDVFDFSKGSIICKNIDGVRFFDDLQDHIDDWNKVENGLILSPETSISVSPKEEHPEAGKEVSVGEDTVISGDDVNIIEKTKPYIDVINTLNSKYGSLRIVQNNREWQNEANGLCYLNLIDFTGDGEDELIAVCKNEDEEHYTGYIYTLNNGKAELIYENPQIEYNFYQGFDLVSLGYAEDTGFIFGTGWVDADADDLTYFWYKNGAFEPVYRSKRTYDGNIEDYIVDEYQAKVDIYDDDHTEKLWERFPTITLRTKSDIDVDGNYYDSHELRKSIDDVIRRLDVSPAELPPDLGLPGMDAIADAEIYFCLENEIDQWEPSIENDEYFWSVIGNYGLSEPRIDDLNPIVTGDIGDAFILDKSIIENAAYASFSDFSGSLPQFRSYPDMWLVREVGEQTVTLGYGELGVMTERKNYEVNKDKSLDVIYTASYFQDEIEPIADYSVHMVENPNYDKENEFFTYYYTVTNIEKIKDYAKTPATADEEAENDGVDPAITDISQVIDMNLTAAEAAHELGLNYEVEDDSE